jgi:hypothetical protein
MGSVLNLNDVQNVDRFIRESVEVSVVDPSGAAAAGAASSSKKSGDSSTQQEPKTFTLSEDGTLINVDAAEGDALLLAAPRKTSSQKTAVSHFVPSVLAMSAAASRK